MTKSGLFITLEGGEGVGKSTLARVLQQRLSAQGAEVVLTREPGGTPFAEDIRRLVLQPGRPENALRDALLMTAARIDHLKELIVPSLHRGAHVVCDRFYDSTEVYQRLGGAAPETLRGLSETIASIRKPDLTLLLDADPGELLIRRESRSETSDKFEQAPLEFHVAVRAAFRALAEQEPERFRVIDALQSPEVVADEAVRHIEAKLNTAADAQ